MTTSNGFKLDNSTGSMRVPMCIPVTYIIFCTYSLHLFVMLLFQVIINRTLNPIVLNQNMCQEGRVGIFKHLFYKLLIHS